MYVETTGSQRPPPHSNSLGSSNPAVSFSSDASRTPTIEKDFSTRQSSSSLLSGDGIDSQSSPYWNQSSSSEPLSPFINSPWILQPSNIPSTSPCASLLSSLVREEGHIYSLAATAEFLYTGSDSKNIRVWRDQSEFSGFKSRSGLVKAIVIVEGVRGRRTVFTGHQDGKVRVWRVSSRNPKSHKRHGSLPSLKDYLKSAMHPSKPSLSQHRDAISSLCVTPDGSILYSGSWDRSFKAWRVADSRCLDSVPAHDDSVNAVVTGPTGLVFTGSADGTVKTWRREGFSTSGKSRTKHAYVKTLLEQESAVTSLALSTTADGDTFLYGGSSDGLVNFWALEKEEMEHGGALRGHTLAVLCIATAGSVVVSGSADKTMCVWRRKCREEGGEHECMAVLTGHLEPLKCLAVVRDEAASSASGTPSWTLYSGSLDKSVKVWRVTEGLPEERNSNAVEEGSGGLSSYAAAGEPGPRQ